MFNNIKGLAIDFDEVMVETIDSLVNIVQIQKMLELGI